MKCRHCDSHASDTARYCENCASALGSDDLDGKLIRLLRLESCGKLEEAVSGYEALLPEATEGVDSALLRKHLGNLHFRMGHLRRARVHLARALELDPHNPALCHDLGVVAYHLADLNSAVDLLRRALVLDPTLHLASFWLGNALYHRGDLDEAARAFARLLEHWPNFTIARFHLGVIYARNGRQQEAEEQFRRVLIENPKDVAARFLARNGSPP